MKKENNTPIYMSIYRSIKEKIEKEIYPVGMFLPSEEELQQEYSVSRTTVRRAISLLSADGLIKVKQGYGTEILRNKVSQCLNSITSVSESLKQKGLTVGVKSMYIERVYASHELSRELKVDVGEPLVLISRIQTADGKPIAISKNYILEKFVPEMIEEELPITSLYKYLNDSYSIRITKVEDRISAAVATFDEAAALDTDPKCALITVRRVCSTGGTPFEVDYVKIIASKYEYRNNFDMEGK